jgi:hypothetical protein
VHHWNSKSFSIQNRKVFLPAVSEKSNRKLIMQGFYTSLSNWSFWLPNPFFTAVFSYFKEYLALLRYSIMQFCSSNYDMVLNCGYGTLVFLLRAYQLFSLVCEQKIFVLKGQYQTYNVFWLFHPISDVIIICQCSQLSDRKIFLLYSRRKV